MRLKCYYIFSIPTLFMLTVNNVSKLKDHRLQFAQHPFLFSVEQLFLLDSYLHFLKAELLEFLSNKVSRLRDMFLALSLCLIHPCSWSEATLTVLLYFSLLIFQKEVLLCLGKKKSTALKDQSEHTLNYFRNAIDPNFARSSLGIEKLTTISHIKKQNHAYFG